MICTLDENNYCQRHKDIHYGHLREIALEDSAYAESIRAFWDNRIPQPPRLLRSLPMAKQCKYLGTENPPEKEGCGSCITWNCSIHGKVKLTRCTQECGEWVHKTICTDTNAVVPRHLLFHLWPKKTSQGTWQRNLDQLKSRWPLFTGKRVIAVATSSDSHNLETVQAYMHGYQCEWVHVENDRNLREVKSFLPLFENIEGLPGHTFYGQGKGATKPINPGISIHQWTSAMYEILLDYWPLVADNLKRFPVVGAFKKNTHGFNGSRSNWHYSGSFCWFDNAVLWSRNWRDIQQAWYGIESYPSMIFTREEAACIFYSRNENFNLYSLAYWKRVEKELEQWRLEQAVNRSDIGLLTTGAIR